MTAEKLHDAISLLPSDLVAEADKKRTGKPRVIPWKRYTAMAACFTLVLSCTFLVSRLFAPKATMDAAVFEEMTADSPAAQAASLAPESDRELSVPEAPAAEKAPMESAAAASGAHHHSAAQEAQTLDEPLEGWCGNTMAWVCIDAREYALSGSDAVVLTDLLLNLRYDPEKLCRCPAEFTADTEIMTGFEISLTQHFVRYENAQADLTPEQADTIQKIIDGLIP